jgi:hypothetical protein
VIEIEIEKLGPPLKNTVVQAPDTESTDFPDNAD